MMVITMTSKITSKGQTTLPKEIRDKLGVHSGDTLIYEVEGNAVRVRKAEPFDLAWHRAISPTLAEWDSTNDHENFVVVPFPFADSDQSVRPPAAVLSRRAFNAEGHTVMATITAVASGYSHRPSIRGIEDAERRPDEVLHRG